MTPRELTALGKAKFGNRWKAPLARAIGVTRGAVVHWAKGRRPIRPEVEKKVREATR